MWALATASGYMLRFIAFGVTSAQWESSSISGFDSAVLELLRDSEDYSFRHRFHHVNTFIVLRIIFLQIVGREELIGA